MKTSFVFYPVPALSAVLSQLALSARAERHPGRARSPD
jgi:hypothetical protein